VKNPAAETAGCNSYKINYSLKRLNRFKENPNVINNVGLAFLNRGNYEKAQKYFNKAIALQPLFYPSLANLAKLYYYQKQYDEALKIYKEIKEYFPEDIKVLQNISHALLRKGDIDKALETLLDLVRKDNKNASAYNNIGVIYILKGNIDRAINSLRKSLMLNANFANAYNNLGACYSLKKDHKRAITSYLSAIALNRNFIYAIKNLARSYQEIEEHEKVFELINKYINQYNSESDFLDILAYSSYKTKKYHQAIKSLKKLIDMPATSNNIVGKARIYNNMAASYRQLGEMHETFHYYLESISLHKYPLTYNNFFNALLKENKLLEAKTIISETRQLFPDNCDLLVSEGKLFHAFKDYDNASMSLRKAMQCNSTLATPYILLNHITTEINKDLPEAIRIAQEGLKYNPRDIALINNLAYALLLTDDKNNIHEAHKLLDRFDSIEDVYLLATRGLLFLKENNVHEAERLYNRAGSITKDKELQHRVKQKKLLELGKYFLNKKEERKAYNYFQKALKIKTRDEIFSDQIKELLDTKF
jgi:superkiller protein 3